MRSYFLCMTKTPSARRDYYIFKFLIAVGILKLFLTYFFLCVEHLKSQFFRSSVFLSFYLPRSIFQESYTIYQALFHFLEIFILQAVREGRKAEKTVLIIAHATVYAISLQSLNRSKFLAQCCKIMRYGYVFFIFQTF